MTAAGGAPRPCSPAGERGLTETVSNGIDFLAASPVAAYSTDAEGRITCWNAAAEALWGQRPEAGKTRYCGSWKLFRADGTPLRCEDCALAVALREARPLHGVEAIVERPDGSRVSCLAYPTPLFDADGSIGGAYNILVDVSGRRVRELATQHLAAIVENSDDAIVSKDLDGRIQSWNRGAERLFGFTAEEAVGQPITMIIPPDRLDEEPRILARLRRGERIDHFETVRRRKDGTLVDISLTVSPVRSPDGLVVGASKVARDVTDRRRAEERQRLLLGEMNHRVKNLLVLAGSLVSLSARSASSVKQLAADVRERLGALARAHELTLPKYPGEAIALEASTSLQALARTIVAPFDAEAPGGLPRVTIGGDDIEVAAGGPLTSMALLLHEFATNAAKYGALSAPGGRVEVHCRREGDRIVVVWDERGGPAVAADPGGGEGFGSLLARATVQGQLAGSIEREWRPDGLTIRLAVDRRRLQG